MKKNSIDKIKDSLSFLLQEINAPISFEITIGNQFYDVDDYEIKKTNDDLPLYKLDSKSKYQEWQVIFDLGNNGKVYSRIFSGYREFLSLIEKEEPYNYSFVILHIPISEYIKIGYKIIETNDTEWQSDKNLFTFAEYLIEIFLYSYRDPHMIAYKDIVRKAGEAFLCKILYSDTDEKNLNIHNDINIISALKYEKGENSGSLLICSDIEDVIKELDLKFDNPISLLSHKKIRKLLEIAKDDIFLIGTPRRVFGLISQESLSKILHFTGYLVKIHGAGNWSIMELRIAQNQFIPIIQCKDSFYQYTQAKFNVQDFHSAIMNRFPHANIEQLTEIVNIAIHQKHGTTVVIAENAKDEANRLISSSFKISPTYSERMIKHITSIDGAVLFDTNGNCHAIGVILDGKASETEDISNGARHNSAKRYKNINTSCVIIIVSEDGYVTALY